MNILFPKVIASLNNAASIYSRYILKNQASINVGYTFMTISQMHINLSWSEIYGGAFFLHAFLCRIDRGTGLLNF